MSRSTLGLAAALLALPLASATAQSNDFRWSGRLAAGRTVEVRNINGDIEASAGGGEVVVTAIKREGRRGDAEDVRIEVVEHEDGVTICALYPSRGGRPANTCEAGGSRHSSNDNNDTEVHFTVRVPAGVRLAAHTVNGGVEADGIAGDVEAYSVNGGVRVTARGLVEASSVNGNVDVTMGRADWRGALKLSTVNGSLGVTLPASASAEVTASSVNGDMDSDFPLTVRGKWGPRRMTGTIGNGGGRSLVLETVNGSIRIRRAG